MPFEISQGKHGDDKVKSKMLLWILIFTFLASVVSLVGGIVLLFKKEISESVLLIFVAFAAGVMISAAFLDLLPEAVKSRVSTSEIFGFTLAGICFFFFVERFLLWFHHGHGGEFENEPTKYLIIFGDAVHNFVDGVTMASAFLVSFPLGVVTSLAVGFHEIPHEMGNFGALLHLGMERRNVLLYNFLSALVAFAGSVLGYLFLNQLQAYVPYVLSFAAGGFIYVAASDLLPEVHSKYKQEKALVQTLAFFFGIVVIWLVVAILG